MIDDILKFYKSKFGFEIFYSIILYNKETYPQYHIDNKSFLEGINVDNKLKEDAPTILTQNGDLRVDLPIWFGNPQSEIRIVILGLEPRDSDKNGHLNIERVDKFVFATPFALEKNYSKYNLSFREFYDKDNLFLYFTDIVKEYEVNNYTDKILDDKQARKNFKIKAEQGKHFLLTEIDLIKPTVIIALGNESYNFLIKNQIFGNYDVLKIRHPSFGGTKKAKEQLMEIIEMLKEKLNIE